MATNRVQKRASKSRRKSTDTKTIRLLRAEVRRLSAALRDQVENNSHMVPRSDFEREKGRADELGKMWRTSEDNYLNLVKLVNITKPDLLRVIIRDALEDVFVRPLGVGTSKR